MIRKHQRVVFTFHTTTDAMAMETYCQARNLPGRLIPIPREITAGCGLAWKTLPGEDARFVQILEEAGIRWEAMKTIELWG